MKQMNSKQFISLALLCGLLTLALPGEEIAPFSDITPAQAAELIKTKGTEANFAILDTRTPAEFAENRIRGAVNVDFKAPDFKDKVEKLDRSGIYLAYCKGGVRSAKAMSMMKERGFKEVYNLAGGLMKWQAEKLPLEGKLLQAEPHAK